MKQYLYAGILLGTVMLAGCSGNDEKKGQIREDKTEVLANEQTVEVKPLSYDNKGKVESATPLKLTQEQKEEYHKRYVEIVEQVMQKKTGIGIEVPPIEQFQLEDWIEPKAYEKKIKNMEEEFLATERETLNALSSTPNKAVTNLNGETKKTAYIYIPDIIRKIEVTGKFETQYNAYNDRQVFGKLENISTQATSSVDTWEQTSYKASLIDGGRTYSIRIEGIYSLNGLSFEKAFTIEFSCDKFGKIY